MIAVILAGGSGRRLGGCCKARLVLPDGRTILEHLQACCHLAGIRDLVVNANDPGPFADCAWPVIPDCRAGLGPAGGIEAALRYADEHAAEAVLLLAGDLPAMNASVISALVEAWHRHHLPQVAWSRQPQPRMHPLCAIVGVDARSAVVSALEAGERAVHRLWARLGAQAVWFEDATAFANLNTPDDLALWTRAAVR